MPSQPSAAQRLRAAAHSGRQDFRQHGGPVSGPGTATSDSIPAQLSDGEFVLPADTVKAVGEQRLRALVKDTHQPSRKPKRRNHLVDGGMPEVRIEQLGKSLKPGTAPSPSNTFPGNRLQGSSGFSGAPVNPVPTMQAIAAKGERQYGGYRSDNPAAPAAEAAREEAINQIPMDSNTQAPRADGFQNAFSNTELGRNLSNTMASLPGIGGVGRVAATGGALSKGVNAGAGAVDSASRLRVAGGGMLPGGGAAAAAASPVSSAPSAMSPTSTALDPETMPSTASAASGSVANGKVTRVGNSYSGTNVTGDVSINGRAPGSGGGPISAQNMAAANGLAQNQKEASQKRNGIDGQAGTDPDAQFSAPTVVHSANDWAARQRLKDLETSASSITNRPEWRSGSSTSVWGSRHNTGVPDPDGKIARFNAAMQADLAAQSKAPDLQAKTNEVNAGLQRTAMAEAGANTREAGRNAVDRDRLTIDANTQTIKNRSLERVDSAQQEYLNADTAQARSTAADRLRALSGQREESPWKAVATRGERRSDGSEAEGGVSLYNTQTAEVRGSSQKPAANTAPPDGTRVLGKDGRTYEVRNGKPVMVGN